MLVTDATPVFAPDRTAGVARLCAAFGFPVHVGPARRCDTILAGDRMWLYLDEVHVGVLPYVDRDELWEALVTRELVPATWLGDPDRGFVGVAEYEPPGAQIALALALDPRGIATAEELARESAARFARWGGNRPPHRVRWHYGNPAMFTRRPPAAVSPANVRCTALAREGALPTANDRMRRGRRRGDPFEYARGTLVLDLECAELYDLARRRNPQESTRGPEPVQLVYAGNPYEPLCELWALGYAAVGAPDRDRSATSEIDLWCPT